jgi:hypothetical protein
LSALESKKLEDKGVARKTDNPQLHTSQSLIHGTWMKEKQHRFNDYLIKKH